MHTACFLVIVFMISSNMRPTLVFKRRRFKTDSLMGLRNKATFNKIDVRFSCFCHIIDMNFVDPQNTLTVL